MTDLSPKYPNQRSLRNLYGLITDVNLFGSLPNPLEYSARVPLQASLAYLLLMGYRTQEVTAQLTDGSAAKEAATVVDYLSKIVTNLTPYVFDSSVGLNNNVQQGLSTAIFGMMVLGSVFLLLGYATGPAIFEVPRRFLAQTKYQYKVNKSAQDLLASLDLDKLYIVSDVEPKKGSKALVLLELGDMSNPAWVFEIDTRYTGEDAARRAIDKLKGLLLGLGNVRGSHYLQI